ncbi:MAG: GntR family transcriptional regulator [Gammaproteobacteria bacterium]
MAQREAGRESSVPRVSAAKRPSLAESAYRQLKADILACRLLPGTLLGAPQLAESLEMSRTPVHEALKALSQEGLVIVAPRVGYRVTPVTVRDIEEIFELRLLNEVHGAGLAARRAASADVSILRARHESAQENLGSGSSGDPAYLESLIAGNRDFHVSVAAMSGNRRLARIVEGLLDEGQRIYFLYFRTHKPLVDTHAPVIAALAARDPETAREAMASHIREQAEGTLAEASAVLG